jgi:hypothetical protein
VGCGESLPQLTYVLRTRLEYQIERRLRCSAEVVKAAGGDYFSKPLFSGLRAQSQSYLL